MSNVHSYGLCDPLMHTLELGDHAVDKVVSIRPKQSSEPTIMVLSLGNVSYIGNNTHNTKMCTYNYLS